MAKEVTVLGLEGDTLRGVRLDADNGTPVRGTTECWPLVETVESGDETAVAPADAETADGGDAVLAEAGDALLARAFSAAADIYGTREFTLALPLSMLLVKTVRVPLEARDMLLEEARATLGAVSPFPDEVLTPGVEIVAETDTEIVAVVAALPEAAAVEVSDALADAKVQVTRTDATAFGWLRGLWPSICERQDVSRRIVLFDLDAGWDLVALEDGAPVYMRGIGAVDGTAELGREVMLSLCQSERFEDGADEVVVCSRVPVGDDVLEQLARFGSVRTLLVEDDFAGVEGVAYRAFEGAAIDVTPALWREARTEARFCRTVRRTLIAAGALLLLVLGVRYGVTGFYTYMASRKDAEMKVPAHRKAFTEVDNMTKQVSLVDRYRDHAHGALEVLKTVSDLMPNEGIVLQSFAYKRGESVRVRGYAEQLEINLDYQDNLKKAAFDDETRLFEGVKSSSNDRTTKKGFPLDLECSFKKDEDADSRGGGSK